jgi:hypothetical protein
MGEREKKARFSEAAIETKCWLYLMSRVGARLK